ncbi:MAG: aminotransferase class I/II-fold pyridoxal phosphate-dependent enzyme, partial [Roseburia sp.]|nr:aminotransferase class I/II-fold pyridoxal phosphate-dependent enzyme [Roseburia sp.]
SIQRAETKYTDNRGTVELRAAAAEYLEKFDLHYDKADEILITMGASEGIDLALRTLVNPGDEVLVVEPAYVSYIPCVELCGGVPVSIPLQANNKFRLTRQELEEKITEKTKVLLISFPNNPTGAIMEREDLESLRQVILDHDIFVITDEIYAELTYGKKHVSIASLPDMYERCVVLNGFSKAFAMTGWRMGIAAGPADVIFHMNKIHQFTTMSAGTTSQYAALEALTSPERDEEIAAMRKEYDERRQIMVEGFQAMGLNVVEPGGAFYVFPSIQETGLSSKEFCERLLAEQKVAVIPGDAFGTCGEGYIRCSYAYSKEITRECLEKIAVFVKSLLMNS